MQEPLCTNIPVQTEVHVAHSCWGQDWRVEVSHEVGSVNKTGHMLSRSPGARRFHSLCCFVSECGVADAELTSFQVRDVGSGAFGVCKLMKNTHTGEMVAVKLMERGDKVGVALAAARGSPGHCALCQVINRLQLDQLIRGAADRHQRGAGGAEPQAACAPQRRAVQGGECAVLATAMANATATRHVT